MSTPLFATSVTILVTTVASIPLALLLEQPGLWYGLGLTACISAFLAASFHAALRRRIYFDALMSDDELLRRYLEGDGKRR